MSVEAMPQPGLSLINYSFGAAGAQPGAEDGPSHLTKSSVTHGTCRHDYSTTVQSELNKLGICIEFIEAVPSHLKNLKKKADCGLITRISRKSGIVKRKQCENRIIAEQAVCHTGSRLNKYEITRLDNGVTTILIETKEQAKSRPPSWDDAVQGPYIPDGIKNMYHVESAVEFLAAAVCRAILTQKKGDLPPLTLGGDHTQGLGTAVGARVAAISKALLRGQIALSDRIPKEDYEKHLAPISHWVEKIKGSDPNSTDEVVRSVERLSSTIASLIDRTAFETIRNKALYKRAKEQLPNGTAAEISTRITELREELMPTLEDTGILPLKNLKNFTSSIHEFWLDAHGDFNTERTSHSKNAHGMPLAAICGFSALANTYDTTDFLELDPRNTHTFGTRDTDLEERALMDEVGVNVYRMGRIQKIGNELPPDFRAEWSLREVFDRELARIAVNSLKTTGHPAQFILSYDGDGIRATEFSATGTPVGRGGPGGQHVLNAIAGIAHNYTVLAHDISEFNPHLGIEENLNLSPEEREKLQNIFPKSSNCPPANVTATRDLAIQMAKSIYSVRCAPPYKKSNS